VCARRLFATALETPGGLKIQTIHAFCEAVLHRFPLEANIPGHFSVLDDQKAAELLAEARRQLMSAQSFENDPDLAAAVTEALDIGGEAVSTSCSQASTPAAATISPLTRKRDAGRRRGDDQGGIGLVAG
jgi:ATP-dependent exoDNAse (exonuclease V) beta subunit